MKIDIKKAQDFLAGHLSRGVDNVESVGQGHWSDAFFYGHSGKDYVIRFSDLKGNFEKDKYAMRFSSAKLPVPDILEIGETDGGYFAISQRLHGKFIDNLSKSEANDILSALFAMFDDMRTLDVSKTRGYGGWNAEGKGESDSWKKWLLSINKDLKGVCKEKLSKSKESTEIPKRMYGYIESNIDYCFEERHIIHGDLLNYNVLVQKGKISAVLDWGCSKYGDFLYDIAWFSFWAPWHEGFKNINFRQNALEHFKKIRLEVSNFGERMKLYEVHIALDSICFSIGQDNWKQAEKVGKQALALI